MTQTRQAYTLLLWEFNERSPAIAKWLLKSIFGVVNLDPAPNEWDFPEEILETFQIDPGNALRAFPGIPLESRGGNLKPYNSRHLNPSRLQSICRILSPSVRLGTPLFLEVVPERASQSWSWDSQQR